MTQADVCAALDVGSNTIRLLVARPTASGLEPILDESEFVRLGAGVDAEGRLNQERMDRGVEAIKNLAHHGEEAGAQSIVAVATSAVRDASNREEFVQRVKAETGVAVDVISGERESELTYRGASLGLNLTSETVVCDLGGGSAELIDAQGGEVHWVRSVPLGSGRLTERFVYHDPPRHEELEGIVEYVRSCLSQLPQARPAQIVYTGGTASHVAWLGGWEGDKIDLDVTEFSTACSSIAAQSSDELVQRGVRPERAQVLPAGVVTLRAIAEFYDVPRVTITRHGIREGIILEHCERGQGADDQ